MSATPADYWFDSAAVDREPYMAPGLVGAEKAARGKLPTSVWWHTIVPTHGAEKTGYPTQKPEGVLRRIVTASSRPGGWCLDFFAGSGTLGAVCVELGRRYVLVDSNPAAIAIARARLGSSTASSGRRVAPAGQRHAGAGRSTRRRPGSRSGASARVAPRLERLEALLPVVVAALGVADERRVGDRLEDQPIDQRWPGKRNGRTKSTKSTTRTASVSFHASWS